MSAITYHKPMPPTHGCTPLHVAGVLRHTCRDMFWRLYVPTAKAVR